MARERKLSPKYLGLLWSTLNGTDPSPLLDGVRARWRAAGPADAPAIAEEIVRWQSRLWKFNSVGHIGKVGGPKSWMEPVSPLLTRQEFRLPIPAPADGKDVTLYLVADDAGDGSAARRGRLGTAPAGRARDARPAAPRRAGGGAGAGGASRAGLRRDRRRASRRPTRRARSRGKFDPAELARKHDVPPDVLAAWFDYLGLGSGDGSVAITSHLAGQDRRRRRGTTS